MPDVKRRIYELLEGTSSGDDPSARTLEWLMMALITLNVFAVVLESVDSVAAQYAGFFNRFELFSVTVFSVEYLLRFWTCTLKERFKRPFIGRLQFALTPLALVDLLAILPFYAPLFFELDLRFIRAVRLVRVFRLLKMARYSESLRMLRRVAEAKKEELVITFFIIFLLLVVTSSLMYFIEHERQPELFSSIPAAMWWAVNTLTTVGYGDAYPQTPIGKVLAGFIEILGIGIFALPAGIFASGFAEIVQGKQTKGVCPHCAKEL